MELPVPRTQAISRRSRPRGQGGPSDGRPQADSALERLRVYTAGPGGPARASAARLQFRRRSTVRDAGADGQRRPRAVVRPPAPGCGAPPGPRGGSGGHRCRTAPAAGCDSESTILSGCWPGAGARLNTASQPVTDDDEPECCNPPVTGTVTSHHAMMAAAARRRPEPAACQLARRAAQSGRGPPSQRGPLGRRKLWKLSSQNVLRFFCGPSEAAEDSRCNGCPVKSVSERRSEREIECLISNHLRAPIL